MKRKAKNYERGGSVRGAGSKTSDSILARVSNGEYILPAESVPLAGLANLERLRQAGLARRYALGGEVNEYGNDLSLANSMNRAAESLAGHRLLNRQREGSAGAAGSGSSGFNAPGQPASALTANNGLAALGNAFLQQQQQQQDADRTTRGRADPLDVASGRFDREYGRLPRFADAGLVGALGKNIKDAWAMADIPRHLADAGGTIKGWATAPLDLSTLPGGANDPRLNRLSATPSPPPPPQTGLASNAPIQSKYYDVSPPNQTGGASSSAPEPAVRGASAPLDYGFGSAFLPPKSAWEQQTGLEGVDALSRAHRANPVSSGRSLIDVAAGGGQLLAPVFAGQSKPVGTARIPDGGSAYFLPSQGGANAGPNRTGWQSQMPSWLAGSSGASVPQATNGVRGSSYTERPVYETAYYDQKGDPIATVTGPNQRKEGGTLSFLPARSVEQINSEIEALRSEREARNPGITTGGSASAGPLVSVGAPGGHFGDEAMAAERARGYLAQATGRGVSKRQREALLKAGLGMLEAQTQSRAPAHPAASSGLAGLTPYQAMQLMQDQGRNQFERQKWAAEQQRQQSLDELTQRRGLMEIGKAQREIQAPLTSGQQRGSLEGQIMEALKNRNQARNPDDLAKVDRWLKDLLDWHQKLYGNQEFWQQPAESVAR